MNDLKETPWHTLESETVLERLGSKASGLTTTEAKKRLHEAGPNQLLTDQHRSFLAMLLAQFTNFMIIVLLIAAVISGLVGEAVDTIAILVIVVLNAAIGAIQEFRAERTLAALRQYSEAEVRVLRDEKMITISSAQLVPGDVVAIEAGNIVSADMRLIEIEQLECDESLLTGESLTVSKTIEKLDEKDLPLGDRSNVVFNGSTITRGKGLGVLIATGMQTEIGRIAKLLHAETGVETPLQKRMAHFGRNLAIVVLVICVVVFIAGLLQGQPVMLMFLTSVSLAIAAIPEALPAVITISHAFGARKLVRHNALVRSLPAVETLGSVTYICADKTGTLTQNAMIAELFVVSNEEKGALPSQSDSVTGSEESESSAWNELGVALSLNNDVIDSVGELSGEPTELALYQAARDAGYIKQQLENKFPRVAAIPFDSERQQMTTLHSVEDKWIAYVKGAPERIIEQCVSLDSTSFSRDELSMASEGLAERGYRVIALARRIFNQQPVDLDPEKIECELTFIGMVALIDPPRTEAEQSVTDCRTAGITPVMITGDHPGTARVIAQRLGILDDDDDGVLSSRRLANLSDDVFLKQVDKVHVYARVSPEQKLRIVKALQSNGEFTAMTGDGVNDAPARRRADIGVAMGQKGTDVARAAADMVLLDDNFSTIVSAIRIGRRIFDNIRNFIKYTMTSNSGEIWTLFLAPFLGLPIPLLPIHILWINLVTDGLPGLAFTAEPAEPNIMKRAPRAPEESIFAHGMWQHIIWVGLLIGGLSIGSQYWAISRGAEYWQTSVFTVLTVSQLFHAMAVRTERESLFNVGLFSNLPLLGAVLLTFAMQLAVIYVPVFNGIFHTQPLPMYDLMICVLLSSVVLFAVETEKFLVRKGLLYQ